MKLVWALLIFVSFTFFESAEAMIILQVKGKRTLIDLQGSSAQVGQSLLVVDANNKRIGTLKVSQVSRGKAIATIEDGVAPEKSKLIIAPSAAASVKKAVKEPEGPRKPYLASVLLGLAANTLSIKVSDGLTSQNVDNTGNSVGLGVAVDRQYFQPWFRARALVAYEQFNTIGAAAIKGCDRQTSRDCTTDIKYLSVGGYGKAVYDYSQFQFWGAFGLNLKVPISKSSTALAESSLGPTAAYGVTIGADYTLESKNFLTASVEKQFYIKSDSAEINTLFIRLGVGREF